MSRNDAETLYNLLPAVYRRRDAQRGFPLRDLVGILAEQAEIVEGDIQRLYENAFIETCDPWVVPYIGDLIGVRPIPDLERSSRAEVANTIGYRRRKGTAAVLEQLARDVTGWPARVVEFFELLSWTQFLNHLRMHSLRTPDLRLAGALDHGDGPFDTVAQSVDVRRIASRRGRHNIRNLGLYVWRIQALPLQLIEPRAVVEPDDGRFTFSTLGNDAPLFHHPVAETGPGHIAEEVNVPAPIRPRALLADLEAGAGQYYAAGRSIAIMVPGPDAWEPLASKAAVACDLGDWLRPIPAAAIAIDPFRGRLRFEDLNDRPEVFRLSCYHGFSDRLGGGQYERASTLGGERTAVVGDPADPLLTPVLQAIQTDPNDQTGVFDNLSDALAQAGWLPGEERVIEILDSRTYLEGLPVVNIPKNGRLTIRAANEQRPTLRLNGLWQVSGAEGSALELNGLLIAEQPLELSGQLNRLTIQHCTLVPGLTLNPDGTAGTPGAVSLTLLSDTTEATIERSILGGLQVASEATVSISDSILDVHEFDQAAYGAVAGEPFGGPLEISRSTVIGRIDSREMTLGENSIFLGVVTAERRQSGCLRFSWVPLGSRVPRRYRCQPEVPETATPEEAQRIAARLQPRFSSLAYSHPAYCQLDWRGPLEITQGADDQSEMGVFSSLKQPQREAALRLRLDEYLPVGLEAGILFAC